jgi:hypothetical protein
MLLRIKSETISNFQLIQSKDKIDSSKLFVAEQINTDAKKDGFVLVKLTWLFHLYINTTEITKVHFILKILSNAQTMKL